MKISIEKLLADKENVERILDNLSDGIIAHDTKRRIFFFNRAAEKINGYSRTDIQNKDCHEAFGSPFCGELCSFRHEAPTSWKDIDYPLNIFTREGEPRRVEMSVTGMTNENGEFAGVLASFKDVTDLISLKIRLGKLTSFSGIIGQDYKMLRVFEQIRELATNDYSVLLTGETGTGKELVASAIHKESRRGGRAFVPINCGGLPEGILESELFGHVKGAFSGAIRDKKGRFELADGGTIFLDEVADLPKSVQVKILRILQEGTFEHVGGEKTESVNARVISATNQDLKREVYKKNFREDLYYRLNVVPIHLPPLRDRKNDIPLLVNHFLQEACEQEPRTIEMSQEALSIMMDYNWPGNIRELQNTIHFALVKCKGKMIRDADLPLELREKRPHRGPKRRLSSESVESALERTGGNKAKAARILGVGRATLYRFLADSTNAS